MILRDLIACLIEYDMNLPVVLASDPEGNRFHVVDLVARDSFTDDEDVPFNGKALVLWP